MADLPRILENILAHKRQEVAEAQRQMPWQALEAQLPQAPVLRPFVQALQQRIQAKEPAVIAEIKKASPSQGVIRANFDPPAIARAYEAAGAACLSVLTDVHFFQGSVDYLRAAREACALPVIRKDFILDPYQVLEARLMGADAILLIVAALEPALLEALETLALDLGLAVLVEVHTAAELEIALSLKTPLIGINNRNLQTFEVSLETTQNLCTQIPKDRFVISESGIHTPEAIEQLGEAGVYGFLIGEHCMRAEDPGVALQALLHGI